VGCGGGWGGGWGVRKVGADGGPEGGALARRLADLEQAVLAIGEEEPMPRLEIIYGKTTNPTAGRQIVDVLQDLDPEGTLYLGYPVLALADDRVNVEALLVTSRFGLVAFLTESLPATPTGSVAWDEIRDRQDHLYGALDSFLGRHATLRSGRKLAFDINTVTLLSDAPPPGAFDGAEGVYTDAGGLAAALSGFNGIPPEVFRNLEAAINKVTTIRPAKKRANVLRADSRGGKLKAIEREIANLDKWQKRSAIEVPEGVQRIRGLAGSGKTVVLALKAAYLHAQHPEWRIALTFYTRSLYQQLEDLARRFSFEHIFDEPDWNRLQVMHCWGSMRERAGIYTVLASELGQPIRDWGYALATYGRADAFAGICRELLDAAKARRRVEPIFDAVLVDEAQDLPQEFFELLAIFTKAPHRIAFAYDELQQLNAGTMPSVEALFGSDEKGRPRVSLKGKGNAREDVVLPVCYRNPPWTLTVAHGLGFGVYREGGLVQHFDNAALWREVGYRVIAGELRDGNRVTLARQPDSYPAFFQEHIDPADAVQFGVFDTDREQLLWMAESIRRNIEEEELDPDDILIVLPDAYTAKTRGVAVVRALAQYGVSAHLVGALGSQDRMFSEGAVTITHIFRAKGNEAAMVYVIDAQYAGGHRRRESSEGLASRRNVLFTAMTRARAWVRVLGVGSDMNALWHEYDQVRANDYELKFVIPTEEERKNLRQLHRDRSAAEATARREALRSWESALAALGRGDIEIDDLPENLRNKLDAITRGQAE
jgi:superfamily I DNA and RNA helicase